MSTVAGTTTGATHDAPYSSCGCTGGPDVWHQFTLFQREEVYLDTANSGYNTALSLTDYYGSPVTGVRNDDAYCYTQDFTSPYHSGVRAVLNSGTYYVAVSGCGTGKYLLNFRHRPVTASLAGMCRASF